MASPDFLQSIKDLSYPEKIRYYISNTAYYFDDLFTGHEAFFPKKREEVFLSVMKLERLLFTSDLDLDKYIILLWFSSPALE